MKTMKRIAVLLAALFFVAGAALSAQAPQPAEDLDATYATDLLKKGRKAPDFKLRDVDGKTYTLKDFRGKTLVIDFWATWCPDCRAETEALVALKKAHPDVVFLGISFDTEKEKLAAYTREHGMDWLQLSEFKKWKETDVSAAYHVKWIPTQYVIDPKGRVVFGTVMLEKVEAWLQNRKR